MDFYNLLYRGYTGEYQLVSSLYRNGLDAVRPPADMGVDVVSLNLKAQLENPQAAPETFFFQVKTASTPINDASMSNGLRALTTVQFKLKESEVDLLGKSSDRALVCYVYSNDNDALTDATEAPFLYFWLDGTLASDGANHYSIKGYLDFARRMRENQQPGEAFGACQGGDAAGPGPENALGDLWRADVEASFGRPSASAERKGPDDDSPFR